MDAFVVAFRLPNLFRRLFGEGALTAAFLPVFVEALRQDRRAAWKLATVTVTLLAVVLVAIVLLLEAALAAIAWGWRLDADAALLVSLTSLMLPYVVLVCVAALLSGVLYGLNHFAAPALAPAILNVGWLAAAWFVAPRVTSDPSSRAHVLAVAIVLSGLLQVAVQLPPLFRLGFHFDYDWPAARDRLSTIVRRMLPMLFGLSVTQLNAFLGSLIAWGLASPAGRGEPIRWLHAAVWYPLDQGAAAAIYCGERIFQFPIGMLGMAVATVIFARLSEHAARGKRSLVGRDLTLGLQLTTYLAVPATVGMILLAEPIASLLFERGHVTPEDTLRVARVIECYAVGVLGACALPVVIRGYYALAELVTPVRVAAWCVGLNLLLTLALLWPLAEAGLALATSLVSTVQAAVLVAIFHARHVRLSGGRLAASLARTCALTAGMAACGWLARRAVEATLGRDAAWAIVPAVCMACGAFYLLAGWLAAAPEQRLLLGGRRGRRDGQMPLERQAEN